MTSFVQKQEFHRAGKRVLALEQPATIVSVRTFTSASVDYVEAITVKCDGKEYSQTLHPEMVECIDEAKLPQDKYALAEVRNLRELSIASLQKRFNIKAYCPCGKCWVVSIARAAAIVEGPCHCETLQERDDKEIDSDNNEYRER